MGVRLTRARGAYLAAALAFVPAIAPATAVLLVARPAAAQPAPAPAPPAPAPAPPPPAGTKNDAVTLARSRSLFERARRLTEQNLWEEACLLFEQAHELHATGGTALQLGNCYEHVSKDDQAIQIYQWILEHADRETVEDRVGIARERLAVLQRRRARVATAPAAPAIAPAPARPSWRTPAYVSLGVGGAGLVVGTLFGALALAQAGDVKSHCVGGVCPTAERDAADGAKAKGWVSTIGFGVGLVGVGVGVALLVVEARARPKAGPATGRIAAGQNGVSFQF